MQITQSVFGLTRTGEVVDKFTLSNAAGVAVELITYGGRVSAIWMPDAQGRVDNIVLGFDELASYEQDSAYIGALVGRYANRIAGACIRIDGVDYPLSSNEGRNQLHGGLQGLHNRVLHAEPFQRSDEVGVELTAVLEDGLEGFPGNLSVCVQISLTAANELKFEYQAQCDKATHVNLTHHGYFNLAGADSGNCMAQTLVIDADRYTPVDSHSIPTGELRSVDNSPFDFRQPKRLDFDSGASKGEPSGFDHNFVLNTRAGELAQIACLSDPLSGRTMELSTTEPGVQLYTSQFLDSRSVNGERHFGPYAGVCLETQHFANSPNEPGFPSTLLRAGETYRQLTIYRFTLVLSH